MSSNLTRQTEKELSNQLLVVYKEAYALLQQTLGPDALEKELNHYLGNKPDNISDVYRQMIGSLKNKQGWVNYIAPIQDMEQIFRDFNPRRINKLYGGNVEALYHTFEKLFGDRYKFDVTNKRNSWLMYTKGVLSAAKFLSTFNDYRAFDEFVQSFFLNEYTIAALPMLLEKEIFGYGFPLACDFLKEIGYTKYGKPDVHLKDVFIGLHLVPNDSDYETFKAIVRTALLAHTEPVIVDKVYWIIGSGKTENSTGQMVGRLKKAFIADMLTKLA